MTLVVRPAGLSTPTGFPVLVERGAEQRLLQLNVAGDELARRRAEWKPPHPRYTRGVLAKYAKCVSSASRGAITD